MRTLFTGIWRHEVEHKLLQQGDRASCPSGSRRSSNCGLGLNTPDGEEMTQKEVADLLGISQSYISRLEKRIIKRLRREIVRLEV